MSNCVVFAQKMQRTFTTKCRIVGTTFARTISGEHKASGTAPTLPLDQPPPPTLLNRGEDTTLKRTTNEVIKQVKLDEASASTFDEMPGPVVLRSIAKLWKYIPIFGNHVTARTLNYVLSADKIFGSQLSWGNNRRIFKYLLDEYGPVVRLHGPFGGDVVILSRPEHASIVFKNEGAHPIRSSLDCVEKYRLQHRQFRFAGPFVMYGPEWETMRKNIDPALKTTLDTHYAKIGVVCDEFVERISAIRNKQMEVPKSFEIEIKKWCLECLYLLMFDKQFGFVNPRGIGSTSETSVLLNAFNNATQAIRACEFGFHLWKIFDTPSWKKLVENCDTIDYVLGKHLKKVQTNLREHRMNKPEAQFTSASLMDCFLLKESLSPEDILTILLDLMILGANMTTHTVAFLLYHLARNPRAQHLVYKEIKDVPDEISKSTLNTKIPFLKACLFESLRLKPPMPVLSRILSKNINVHGYDIPKGTYVLIATHLSSLREEYFEDPLKFKPERWLGYESNKDIESLATTPFGFGPKACLAKDLAEVQIYSVIVKILKKFHVEYHYGDIESNNRLLAGPTRSLRFRFVDRN